MNEPLGRVAFEAMRQSVAAAHPETKSDEKIRDEFTRWEWEQISIWERECWEAAAQAVLRENASIHRAAPGEEQSEPGTRAA